MQPSAPITATVTPSAEAPEGADGSLSERAADALRALIPIRSSFACEEYSLRRRLRALCNEARRADVPPQQLPLLFERVWRSLPEGRSAEPARGREIMDRVIAICVEEYNATSTEPPAKGP